VCLFGGRIPRANRPLDLTWSLARLGFHRRRKELGITPCTSHRSQSESARINRLFHKSPHQSSTTHVRPNFVALNHPISSCCHYNFFIHCAIPLDSQKLLNDSRSHYIQFCARYEGLRSGFLFFPLLSTRPLSASTFL
jgi:hypothetical protein